MPFGLLPQINADQRLGSKRPGGFFQRLAHHRIDELLAAFDMTGRLVEHHAIGHPLFHEQELAVAFHDGGHGEVRAQGHGGSIATR